MDSRMARIDCHRRPHYPAIERMAILELKGEYAITCVSFSVGGPLVSLIMTDDFKTFKRIAYK